MMAVFLKALRNASPVNSSTKLSGPTKVLPKTPLDRLKSWKAITMPNMGR